MKPLTTAILFSLIMVFLASGSIYFILNSQKTANIELITPTYRTVMVDSNGYRDDEIMALDTSSIPPVTPSGPDSVPVSPLNRRPKPGEVAKSYTWNYQGADYRLDLFIDPALVSKYQSERISWNSENDFYGQALKLDPEDKSIDQLVYYFSNLAKLQGWNDNQLASAVVAWIQSLPYETDGSPAKRPLQTLQDGRGDCDDKSLVGYLVLKGLGFGVSLLSPPDHMAIGISSPNSPNGYAYAETTARLPIGQLPDNLRGQSYTIIQRSPGSKSYNIERAI